MILVLPNVQLVIQMYKLAAKNMSRDYFGSQKYCSDSSEDFWYHKMLTDCIKVVKLSYDMHAF